MEEKKDKKMRKTSRQLAILHIFLYSQVVEIIEITRLIKGGVIIHELPLTQKILEIAMKIYEDDPCRCFKTDLRSAQYKEQDTTLYHIGESKIKELFDNKGK